MYSVDDVTHFLIGCGLVDRAWVIEGDLAVHSAARRNRNLRVEGPVGAGYLIKQPDDSSEGSRHTLHSEAKFYRLCQEKPWAATMKSIVPSLAYSDPHRALLALELVPEAVPLWSSFRNSEPDVFPNELSWAVGCALGTVHQVFDRSGPALHSDLAWLGREVPWVMMVHEPSPGLLTSLSPANARTIRILQQQEGLAERLDSMRSHWRIETVIHGDIKFDNILTWKPGEKPNWEVRIVDWEMVQFGDPAWDLAGALQDFLGFWVDSMPLDVDLRMEERVAQAGYPLSIVQAAIRSFWGGYRGASASPPRYLDDLMSRAVELSAARLIQTAYEVSYQLSELSPRSVALLQITANILSNPDLARLHLYGVPMVSLIS
jgi:Phosphotransferase enzyme family